MATDSEASFVPARRHVRSRRWAWLIAVGVVVTGAMACWEPVPVAAQSGVEPGAAGQEAGGEADDRSPLWREMETIEDELRQVRRSLRDPERREEVLERLDSIQLAVVRSKAMEPKLAASVEPEKREAMRLAYRRMMSKLLIAFAQAEVAVIDEDVEAAYGAIREALALRMTGHGDFRDPR